VPPHHGGRLDEHHRVNAAGPETIEQNPEYSVEPTQPDPGLAVTSKNFQLVAESHHLELQIGTSSEARENAMEDGNQDVAHAPTLRGIGLKSQNFCGGWN
jgi:hypothetical protein